MRCSVLLLLLCYSACAEILDRNKTQESGGHCAGTNQHEPPKLLLCHYGGLIPPASLDPCLCSHVILTDWTLDDDLTLHHTQFGDLDFVKEMKSQNPKLKVLLMLGGSVNGSVLARAAADPQDATQLAEGLADFLAQHHLDGIDIQWDPALAARRDNFTTLLKIFRQGLDRSVENTSNSHEKSMIIVSIAKKYNQLSEGYNFPNLLKFVDYFYLPAYNFTDLESHQAMHHSRLLGSDAMNADSLLDLLIGLHVPAKKIVLGIPAFGLYYQLVDELDGEKTTPAANGSVRAIGYQEICKAFSKGNWTIRWDNDKTAPFASKRFTWVGYDDPASVRIKSKYALLRNLAGIGLWRVDQEDFNNTCGKGRFPLLSSARTIYEELIDADKGRVMRSLAADIEPVAEASEILPATSTRPPSGSPFRITSIVDRSGQIQVITDNSQTNMVCTRPGYYRNPNDCTHFYRCIKFNHFKDDFTIFEYNCPPGLVFDEKWEVCNWPSTTAPCGGSSEILPVPRNKFLCPAEGYFTDPENCRWFYKCSDLHGDGTLTAYEFRCPFDLAFDETKIICNWRWFVPSCGNSGHQHARPPIGPFKPTRPGHSLDVGFTDNGNIFNGNYPDGSPGPDGPFPNGSPGPDGPFPNGSPGPDGPFPEGSNGPLGTYKDGSYSSGPNGPFPEGSSGPNGPFPHGFSGPDGPYPEGPSGPDGPYPEGPSGPNGPDGSGGLNGPSGPSGPSGPRGPSGPSGPRGPSGPSGPRGPGGPSGPSGPGGSVGPNEFVGATRPLGFQGSKNPSGFQSTPNSGRIPATISVNSNQGSQSTSRPFGGPVTVEFHNAQVPSGTQGSLRPTGSGGFQGTLGSQGSAGSIGTDGFHGSTGPNKFIGGTEFGGFQVSTGSGEIQGSRLPGGFQGTIRPGGFQNPTGSQFQGITGSIDGSRGTIGHQTSLTHEEIPRPGGHSTFISTNRPFESHSSVGFGGPQGITRPGFHGAENPGGFQGKVTSSVISGTLGPHSVSLGAGEVTGAIGSGGFHGSSGPGLFQGTSGPGRFQVTESHGIHDSSKSKFGLSTQFGQADVIETSQKNDGLRGPKQPGGIDVHLQTTLLQNTRGTGEGRPNQDINNFSSRKPSLTSDHIGTGNFFSHPSGLNIFHGNQPTQPIFTVTQPAFVPPVKQINTQSSRQPHGHLTSPQGISSGAPFGTRPLTSQQGFSAGGSVTSAQQNFGISDVEGRIPSTHQSTVFPQQNEVNNFNIITRRPIGYENRPAGFIPGVIIGNSRCETELGVNGEGQNYGSIEIGKNRNDINTISQNRNVRPSHHLNSQSGQFSSRTNIPHNAVQIDHDVQKGFSQINSHSSSGFLNQESRGQFSSGGEGLLINSQGLRTEGNVHSRNEFQQNNARRGNKISSAETFAGQHGILSTTQSSQEFNNHGINRFEVNNHQSALSGITNKQSVLKTGDAEADLKSQKILDSDAGKIIISTSVKAEGEGAMKISLSTEATIMDSNNSGTSADTNSKHIVKHISNGNRDSNVFISSNHPSQVRIDEGQSTITGRPNNIANNDHGNLRGGKVQVTSNGQSGSLISRVTLAHSIGGNVDLSTEDDGFGANGDGTFNKRTKGKGSASQNNLPINSQIGNSFAGNQRNNQEGSLFLSTLPISTNSIHPGGSSVNFLPSTTAFQPSGDVVGFTTPTSVSNSAVISSGISGNGVNNVLGNSVGSRGSGARLVGSEGDEPLPGRWGALNGTSFVGPVACERAGLFRHPDDCSLFYECYWDRWLDRFTIHYFECPVRLAFDHSILGCNWPARGPPCHVQ